ncbi:MAG: MFS transporter [Oscillospiraceae bacterium]|jgi:GPH family glycoside/pentoside/hexuronide:cation symporter|nr:MFS transporter [Oscillospiraceae bacterium]
MARAYNRPWRYALAMLGMSVAGYMYQTYGTYYYTDKLYLPLSAIAVGNVFFTIWDAFNDPITGVLSDRTRTRWGRRKPWLMAAIPLFTLFSILFFSPPASLGSGAALAVYFTVFLMLTETAGTIANVNYHSLLPELFRDVGERNRANAIRQALQLVGMIVGVSLVPLIASALDYRLTAVLLGAASLALLLYSILGCKERLDFSQTPQPRLADSLKALAVNRNFWFVSVSHFFYQATSGLLLAGIPFFIKYALGLPDSGATFLSAAVFVTAIPAMWVWYKIINRIGALKTWRAALIWLGVSLIPMYFASALVTACLAGTMLGIGIAGITANLDMINSELIESDAERHGVRREATFFAGISFVTRISGVIRTGVFLMLSSLFGFVSGENPGDAPGTAARYMMTVFPIILMALSAAASFMVRFDKDIS